VHLNFQIQILTDTQTSSSTPATTAASSTPATTESSDPKKKPRNKKKKLTDIESLKSRLDSGELKNTEPEQLEKLKRRDQIEAEIMDLEKMIKTL